MEPSWGHLGRLKRQSGEVAKMPENAIRIAFSGFREFSRGPRVGPSWGSVAILSPLDSFLEPFKTSYLHLVVILSSSSRLEVVLKPS